MISYPNDKFLKPDNNGNAAGAVSHLLAGSKNLPTLPEVNLKLIKACNSSQNNTGEIADLIMMDPSLSLKIIDMYYSNYQRCSKKLDSLENAIKLIGADAVNIMVSCSSAVSIFDANANVRGFDFKLFWRHSLKCAYLAEIISKDVPAQSSDEAYLSGLFHDIGKVVLLNSLPNIYSKLLSDKEQGSIILKEKKTIGIDHSYIAYRLVDRWHYYPFMADALLYHHYPVEKIIQALPPVKILYLANMLASQEAGDQRDALRIAGELFGFSRDKLDEYILYADTRLSRAASIFEIDNSSPGQIHTSNGSRGEAPVNLANEIRDSSLIAYTMQNILGAKDEESVLQILKQGYQILFGNSDIYFFLYDKNENALIGFCPGGEEFSGVLNGLRIPANSNSSILNASLRDNETIYSLTYLKKSELPIIDSELIHLTGREGILCVPMIERDERLGIMVLGIDRSEYSFLSKHVNLLNLFARQCALALLNTMRKTVEERPSQSVVPSQGTVLSKKIIHEINNPLSVIKNYLKVLGMKLEDHKIDHDEIRIINDEINRISKMLKNMSGPADKPSRPVQELVNVNALLLDIIKLTNGSLGDGSDIKISLDNDPSIPGIMTARDDLKQVFMNLIKNAVEAMPLGGNIGIKTSCLNGKKNAAGGTAGKADGKIQIIVSDDGPGISDEIRSALFNEFVTSKQGHEGLGLSIVKGIINKLNGSIRCESIMDKGTSFIIDLPLKAFE
jgi:nitrogen-specific signal transduction histidine kinase/HD-like signal output (HDOD) protein